MSRRLPSWLDRLGLLALFGVLLAVTWRRWPDALVDFWRNLYIPWRLSEGALLYVDVNDWYGPLSHLVAAAVFTVVGPGLDVLIILDAAVAVGCLLALHAALLQVGDRPSAFVGALAFLLIHVFGNYSPLGNYNYLTPYVTQATWGFLGVLLCLVGMQSALRSDSRHGELLAGVGLALALLSKSETFAAALCVWLAGAFFVRRLSWRTGVGFLLLVLPVWAALAWRGGPVYALQAVTHAVHFAASAEGRAAVSGFPVFSIDLGTDALAEHAARHALLGLAALSLVAVLAWVSQQVLRGRTWLPWVLTAGALVLVSQVDWVLVGPALLVPTLAALGWSGVRAVRGGTSRHAALALLAVGALGMLARMLLNVRLYHYGFTMSALATALLGHLVCFEVAHRGEAPGARLARLPGTVLVLAVAVRLLAGSLEALSLKAHPVAEGRDAIVAWSQQYLPHATIVSELLGALREQAPAAQTLVVFPDGGALNYLSRTPAPGPDFEFNPVSLAFAGGPEQVLRRLEANPPEVVALTAYELRAYGVPFFGAEARAGAALLQWVGSNYTRVAHGGPNKRSPTGHAWDLFVRRQP